MRNLLFIPAWLWLQVIVFAQQPQQPDLPEFVLPVYDMSYAQDILFKLVFWNPIVWYVLVMLAIRGWGAFMSRL